MSGRLRTLGFIGLAIVALVARPEGTAPSGSDAIPGVRSSSGSPALLFARNLGQAGAQVRFVARGAGQSLALTTNEAIVAVGNGSAENRTLRLRFLGANDQAAITATDPAAEPLYFSPAHAHGPATRIPQFHRVTYSDLYPGVDVVYYGNERQLEFDVAVGPHADPAVVRFALDGADSLDVLENGDLSAHIGNETIRVQQPLVYQERNGGRTAIAARYVVERTANGPEIGFDLSAYDQALPVVIDPVVILHSNGDDTTAGIEVNADFQTYVLAETTNAAGLIAQRVGSNTFPNPSCYLTKLSPSGATMYTLLFTDTTLCSAMAMSPFGTVYFAGYERPLVPNLNVATVLTIEDRFGAPVVQRMQADNYNQLANRVAAMEVDITGSVYLIGLCRVVNYTTGQPGPELNGFNDDPSAGTSNPAPVCSTTSAAQGAHQYQTIFTKLDSGGGVQYGTFLTPDDVGGTSGQWGLAIDGSGRAYVTGLDRGSLTPTTNAFRNTCGIGKSCAYLMAIDTALTGPQSLRYASYLWRISAMSKQLLRYNGQSVYVAMDGIIESDLPETPRKPYEPFRGYDAPAGDGVELARFNLDVDHLPSQLAYALQTTPGRATTGDAPLFTNIHALNDLRILPSGAAAVTSVLTESSGSAISHRGLLDVFYKSGQLRASELSVSLPENTRADAPMLKIAADSKGMVYKASTTVTSTPGVWDVAVENLPNLDPPGNGNTPPRIAASGPFTGEAVSLAGTLVPWTVAAFDAEDADGTIKITCSQLPNGVFPVGVTHVTCTAVDSGKLSAATAFDVTVTRANNIGPAATGVPIDVIDARSLTGQANTLETVGKLTMTFIGTIDGPGFIDFQTRTDQNPRPPTGLQSGSSPYYYDVATTVTMAGANSDIRLCIDYTGMSFARDVSTPRLYRLNGTTPDDWVDVTQDVDQATHQICAIAHSPAQLGTFALFTPANEATRVTTLAGNGSGPQFPPGGGVVNGDGGPAVSAALREPSNVAFDLQHDVMYIADGFAVRAVKLSTGVITTYAGNGYQPPFGDIRENVLATDTGIFQVTSVAVDADGNLFLAEPSNCIVRRIDFATRIITTVAGHWTGDQASSCGYTGDGGAARNAQLAATGLIKFDATGDLFLVHLAAWPQGSNTGTVIRRIARSPGDGRIKGRDDEIISTIAGNGTPAAVQGAEPLSTGLYGGFAFGNHNDLYAFANFQLVRIFEGHTQIVAGLGFDPFRPPFAGDQLHPLQAAILGVGIVVLPSGDVLFSDLNAQKIRRISPGADGVVDGSPDERITTIAGFTFPLTALSQPNQLAAEGYALSTAFPLSGLTIDPRDGGVITSDIFLLRVRKFGPSLSTTNHPPIANAGVDQPGATNPVHLDGSASSDPDNDPLTFEWSEGTTALGTGAQLTVSLGAGSHTITLRVTDNHGASTTDTVVVSVGGGDLAITATASASQVHALDSLQYTVAALNLGSVAVDPVQLVVTLPQGMQFIGSSPASCSASGTTLTCALGSIAAGAKRTTIIDVRAALLGAFSTTFDVSSPAAESDPTNNSVTLSGSADLYLAESVGVADVSTMQRSLILPLISEDVIVADASAPRPSVMLPLISENIVVADTASIPDATAPLTVTLLAPVEGARLFTDVPTTIQWRVTGQPTSFDVELSTTAIDLFQPLSGCANLPASATSCVWMPPAPLRIARVRVVAHGQSTTAIDTSGAFSVGAKPLIRVTSPNSDVHWAIGTKQLITWTHNLGTASLVRIELSRDSGFNWETLGAQAQSTTATSGQFEWVVTGPPTPNALIKITSSDGSVFDIGNTLFAIEAPQIVVTSPNGFQNWVVDSLQTIMWTHNLGTGESVSIELSRDGGSSWTTIASAVANTGATSGQYNWRVDGPVTVRARIRVRWSRLGPGGAPVGDDSDATFTIASRIRITTPSAPQTWGAGVVLPVTWTHDYGPAQKFDIDTSADGGATWVSAARGVPAPTPTSDRTLVRMPEVLTSQALIRVSPAGRPDQGDVSWPITLVAPHVTVLPHDATQIGRLDSITWSGNLGLATAGYRFFVSGDSGGTWQELPMPSSFSMAGPVQMSARWQVTGPATTHARLRVTWSGGALTASDDSDADFTIASRIHITTPSGLAPLGAGGSQLVTWTHDYGATQTFDIDTSTDGGATWVSAARGVPADTATLGRATVRLPAVLTTQALIRVSPAGRPDQGEVSFRITLEAPKVTVLPLAAAQIGPVYSIDWSTNLGIATSGYRFYVSRDSGVTWQELPIVASDLFISLSGQMRANWRVTGPVTIHARLRVTWSGGGLTASDDSDADFTIVPGIEVTAPNTAVSWVVGSVHPITWVHFYGANSDFDIDFSPDGGTTWTRLASAIRATGEFSGRYSWTVGNTPTNQALIRVSPINTPGDGDVSDVTFAIVPPRSR